MFAATFAPMRAAGSPASASPRKTSPSRASILSLPCRPSKLSLPLPPFADLRPSGTVLVAVNTSSSGLLIGRAARPSAIDQRGGNRVGARHAELGLHLEGFGPAVGPNRQHLSVEHQPAAAVDPSRTACGAGAMSDFAREDYRYGFTTDIASESFAKGIDESVVRAISAARSRPCQSIPGCWKKRSSSAARKAPRSAALRM